MGSSLNMFWRITDHFCMFAVLQADLETDEVYAQMTLIPVPPIVSI
jgi:hypothetical protein